MASAERATRSLVEMFRYMGHQALTAMGPLPAVRRGYNLCSTVNTNFLFKQFVRRMQFSRGWFAALMETEEKVAKAHRVWQFRAVHTDGHLKLRPCIHFVTRLFQSSVWNTYPDRILWNSRDLLSHYCNCSFPPCFHMPDPTKGTAKGKSFKIIDLVLPQGNQSEKIR